MQYFLSHRDTLRLNKRSTSKRSVFVIRRINIKAQHSAFSRAINRTVSYGLYMSIKSDVSSLFRRHLQTRYKIH